MHGPNVVVEWLTPLLHIREILVQISAIVTEGFHGFPQSKEKCYDSTLN
jgi:hypothetical protein